MTSSSGRANSFVPPGGPNANNNPGGGMSSAAATVATARGAAGSSGRRSPFAGSAPRLSMTTSSTAQAAAASEDSFLNSLYRFSASTSTTHTPNSFRFSPRHAANSASASHTASTTIIPTSATAGEAAGSSSSSLQHHHQPPQPPTLQQLPGVVVGNGGGGTQAWNNNSSGNGNNMDGMNLDTLRTLARDVSNLSNLFFAQLLYCKTASRDDALLLARVYLQHGQAASCWRLVEDSGALLLLQPRQQQQVNSGQQQQHYSASPAASMVAWSALELAVTALATTEDWTMLQQLVQEVVYSVMNTYPHHLLDGGGGGFVDTTAAPTPSSSSWEAQMIWFDSSSSSSIMPLQDDEDRVLASRVWYWRGRAHWELGDPVLATEYLSTALQWDPRNQVAWNAMVSLQLVTPLQAYRLVMSLKMPDEDDWLRSLYLAQIPVTQQPPRHSSSTGSSHNNLSMGAAMAHHHPEDDESPSDYDFGDASSIQILSSPLFAYKAPTTAATTTPRNRRLVMNDENNLDITGVAAATDENAHARRAPSSTAAASKAVAATTTLAACHEKVQEAFDKLTHTYKLAHSPHVLALAARRAYHCYDWKNCLWYCEQLLAQGSIIPSASSPTGTSSSSSTSSSCDAAYCYVSVLVLLGRHRSLFQLAHEWVSAAPKSPQSWFAVGAYYYATGRYHVAQRHFCRATRLDPHCSPAWMAFGCSFAIVDESDQALASFRAANRLAPGDALPLLYMGVEYVRTNHLTLARYFLQSARVQSQDDPLCLHELGVLELAKGNLDAAISWFTRALRTLHKEATTTTCHRSSSTSVVEAALAECSDPYWEPTIFNLGHAYRKSRQFELAKACFERCIALTTTRGVSNSSGSSSASAYAALAFTTHLSGNVDDAISLYHQALACKPDDPFSSEMLNRSLRESMLLGLDEDKMLKSIVAPTPPATTGGGGLSSSLTLTMMKQQPFLQQQTPFGSMLKDDSILLSASANNDDSEDDEDDDMDSDVDMSG